LVRSLFVSEDLLRWAVGLLVASTAFLVRTAIHVGRMPGGVDTWYYLAYAQAFRRRPSLDVRLPQYLLQDELQSYPPLFPSLLALLPQRWLDRVFWLLAPLIDCVHLGLLYVVTLRLTGSLAVGVIAASAYAFTPHLISETRSLSPRPFAALLHTLAVLAVLKWTTSDAPAWALAAVLLGAFLFLSSAAMAAAYGFACASLGVAAAEPRFWVVPFAGLLLAFALTRGRMERVVWNYLHAVAYWRRNRHLYGAHPVRNSPVLGNESLRPIVAPGLLGRTTLLQVLRLLAENPFLVALPLAPVGYSVWSQRLYVWALALAALAIIATTVPLLRAFGPGRSYIKASIFPTAFTLSYGIGGASGVLKPFGLLVLSCLAASVAGILFFLWYVRSRPTEQTASVPSGLAQTISTLADLPPGGVFVLPYMYADVVCYRTGKPVVWGGHCGDHRRFEWVAPVITRPPSELFRELSVRYVLIDSAYVHAAEELKLSGDLSLKSSNEGFQLYDYVDASASSRTPG
jgi:hypothetical protein